MPGTGGRTGRVQTSQNASSARDEIQASKQRSQQSNIYGVYPLNVYDMRRVSFSAYEFNGEARAQGVKSIKGNAIRGRVVLPLPFEITAQSSAQWASEDLVISPGQEGFVDNSLSSAQGLGARALKASADAVGLGAQAAIATGKTVNPNSNLAYVAHNLRTVAYTFAFVPRNASEAKQIQQIKKFFQREQHASLQNGQLSSQILKYPSTFAIEYFEPNNTYVSSLTPVLPCHLVDMNIIENSHGFSAFIKDEATGKSYPTMTMITLTFQESRMRFREDYTGEIDESN